MLWFTDLNLRQESETKLSHRVPGQPGLKYKTPIQNTNTLQLLEWRIVMSEGQGEGSVAQVGKDVYSTAVARCSQDLTLWGCWLLVEAQAEQSWGGTRHLGLKLPTQLPVIDTAALASRQDQVLVEGDMLLWCSNGKDRSGCGRPEVPEGEGGAPSTDHPVRVSCQASNPAPIVGP